MRFQFIDDCGGEFPVSLMGKVLEVSRSRYYAWRGRPPSEREMANRQLYKRIKRIPERGKAIVGAIGGRT